MEFLKALREAERMGISKSDFIPIWEKEMDQNRGSSSNTRTMDTKDSPTDTGVYKHIEQLATEVSSLKLEAQNLRQEVMTLRTDLLNQSREVIQETVNQCLAQHFSDFEKKKTGDCSLQEKNSTEVVKETINQCLAQHFSDFEKKLSKTGDRSVQEKKSKEVVKETVNQWWDQLFTDFKNKSPESGKPSMQEEKINNPSAVKSGDNISSESDTNLTTGEFIIEFDELESSSFHSKILSPSYELSPSCTVKLACWVNGEDRVHFTVALWASNHVPLTSDTSFKITGRIKNKNSEKFSELFTGETKKLNKLQALKKEWFGITVCLETTKFSYSEVTLDVLKQKGFVIDDTLVIAWDIEQQ